MFVGAVSWIAREDDFQTVQEHKLMAVTVENTFKYFKNFYESLKTLHPKSNSFLFV